MQLVLSDCVVAYVSHKFASRYVVSIAHEWEGFKETKKGAIVGMIALVTFTSLATIIKIPDSLCLTSQMPNEGDWALTQCPDISEGTRNITNLLRVDDMFLTEWGEIT
jgi:hypothetical protein